MYYIRKGKSKKGGSGNKGLDKVGKIRKMIFRDSGRLSLEGWEVIFRVWQPPEEELAYATITASRGGQEVVFYDDRPGIMEKMRAFEAGDLSYEELLASIEQKCHARAYRKQTKAGHFYHYCMLVPLRPEEDSEKLVTPGPIAMACC